MGPKRGLFVWRLNEIAAILEEDGIMGLFRVNVKM